MTKWYIPSLVNIHSHETVSELLINSSHVHPEYNSRVLWYTWRAPEGSFMEVYPRNAQNSVIWKIKSTSWYSKSTVYMIILLQFVNKKCGIFSNKYLRMLTHGFPTHITSNAWWTTMVVTSRQYCSQSRKLRISWHGLSWTAPICVFRSTNNVRRRSLTKFVYAYFQTWY